MRTSIPEIEHVLETHGAVAAATVVGVPDEAWGEHVAAFVRTHEGVTVTEEELARYVQTNVAPHKAPMLWHVVDERPLSGSAKVKKHELQAQLEAGIMQ